MYVKYKIRKPVGLVVPKGPAFAKSRKMSIELDSTIIKFRAPKHRPRRANNRPVIPGSRYKLNDITFKSSYSEGFTVSDNWEVFDVFRHMWAFYGPWFTGTVAELEMYFQLVRPVKYKQDDFSLFHPRAFEKVVGDYLTNEFSLHKSKTGPKKHYYIAPVNWQPLTKLPVVAVRLEVIPDETVISLTRRYFVFFPVDDKILSVIQFIPSQLRALPQEELDKLVDRSTMLELMENIIDSFEIKLSAEAKEHQNAALAGLEDVSLIKTHLPLKWSRSVDDISLKSLESQSY